MPAGMDFTLCRPGRGLAASRRPFGDARLPVRHCAAGAEVPPRRQTTQPKNEVLTSSRDLTLYNGTILRGIIMTKGIVHLKISCGLLAAVALHFTFIGKWQENA